MTKTRKTSALIHDNQRLVSAKNEFGRSIPIYDDGFGPLFIHRCSMGISGIVRAQTWEDAYSICEDEFFPEANEAIEEIVKEYGFKREHEKVIKSPGAQAQAPYLNADEKFAELSDYSDNGKLPDGLFIRWETVETPDPEAWTDNALFQESFGFRPNGPNAKDTIKHGIYARDLNGDRLDTLTPELLEQLEITLEIETED